ncbi:trafficking protein particle complex subunit 2-like protein isoform X2 [Pituophis catenifer annectens]|uniref:trafficking protein particle complex subunit 2-like protein isoform X2 n=1 Tax=Pituophis catenifer annectens TaxID=94852 RepID=UPI0039941F3C
MATLAAPPRDRKSRAQSGRERPGSGVTPTSGSPSKNYPLYIKSIPTENELKFHYTVHTSLDVVDEKVSALGKALVDQRELYLGLLYPTEDYKVYGYVTNSKVKFVMVVDSSNTALRDNEIRSMFRKLHNSYTDVMCNPFYNPGDQIQSRAFDNMVMSMMVQVC